MTTNTKPKGYADGVPVWCSYDEIVPIDQIKGNPRNPNKHPENQIALGAKIIKGNGWRLPIVISKRSGLVTKGHGRLLFAFRLNVSEVPVDYQDYATEADEWADVMADNKFPELAQFDVGLAIDVLKDLDDFNFDLTLTALSDQELSAMLAESDEVTKEILGGKDMSRELFSNGNDAPQDPAKEWDGMPEFHQEDKLGKVIIVHFETEEDKQSFAELVGQKITASTKYIWYPEQSRSPYPDAHD